MFKLKDEDSKYEIIDSNLTKPGIYKFYVKNKDCVKDFIGLNKEQISIIQKALSEKNNNNVLYIGKGNESILFRLCFHLFGLDTNSNFRKRLGIALKIPDDNGKERKIINKWIIENIEIEVISLPEEKAADKEIEKIEKEEIKKCKPPFNIQYNIKEIRDIWK